MEHVSPPVPTVVVVRPDSNDVCLPLPGSSKATSSGAIMHQGLNGHHSSPQVAGAPQTRQQAAQQLM